MTVNVHAEGVDATSLKHLAIYSDDPPGGNPAHLSDGGGTKSRYIGNTALLCLSQRREDILRPYCPELTAAGRDDAPEKAARLGRNHQHGLPVGSRRLSEHRHIAGIAAERGNIRAYPLESRNNIAQP